METYETLKKRAQELAAQKVRLATQLEELTKQEETAVAELRVLGVTDIEGQLAKTDQEVQSLRKEIEADLTALEQ